MLNFAKLMGSGAVMLNFALPLLLLLLVLPSPTIKVKLQIIRHWEL